MLDRIIAVSVYYVGGLVVCLGIALGNALNGSPIWYSLIAPAVYAVLLAITGGPEFPLPSKTAALALGPVAFAVSLIGHLAGPALFGS